MAWSIRPTGSVSTVGHAPPPGGAWLPAASPPLGCSWSSFHSFLVQGLSSRPAPPVFTPCRSLLTRCQLVSPSPTVYSVSDVPRLGLPSSTDHLRPVSRSSHDSIVIREVHLAPPFPLQSEMSANLLGCHPGVTPLSGPHLISTCTQPSWLVSRRAGAVRLGRHFRCHPSIQPAPHLLCVFGPPPSLFWVPVAGQLQ